MLGNDILLGRVVAENGKMLQLSRELRDKHLYICGGTGTGKSKFLENLIRQDINSWDDSGCGMLVLDPHGSLYDNLISWLAWYDYRLPIIPIDLRQDEWVVAYNLLRSRGTADPAVLVDNLTDAMAHVWGQAGTNQTPLFARWAGNVIRALYEKGMTLLEAEHLIDHLGSELRRTITADLKDKALRRDWQFASTLSPKEFEAQVGSTINRLQRFMRNQTMRSIFGQGEVSLDLGRALDEGAIILVSLATERGKISKENSELFATLLLSDLWTAAQERGKRDQITPFYVYLDEFQRFVTPTIAENLDEARGFGLHLTMAHQFPNQLLDRGENGRRVYNSIMENASSKVVFRLSHEENLRVMAQWLFGGVMDPDEIKLKLFSRKVMDYSEEIRDVYSEGSASGQGSGSQHGYASGEGSGGTRSYSDFAGGLTSNSASLSWSRFASDSRSDTDSYSTSESSSVSQVPMLIPVFGEELSHVQFRSLEEQLSRAMTVLFDQKERQCVGRLVGMKAPVSLFTPEVEQRPTTKSSTRAFLKRCYTKLPFVLSSKAAGKVIEERAKRFALNYHTQGFDEPTTAKRRLH